MFAFALRIQLEIIKVLTFFCHGLMGLGGKRGFMHVILYGQSVCPDWCIWIFNREIKETYKILKENNVYCLLFMLVMTCEL